MTRLLRYSLGLAVVFYFSSVYSKEDVNITIIAHKDFAVSSITSDQLKDLWLFKIKKLPGTNKVTPVDQAKGSAVRNVFYSTIIEKTPSQFRSYWAKLMFMGKGYPPAELTGDEEIVQQVASTPGAIGYVNKTANKNSVKVLQLTQ